MDKVRWLSPFALPAQLSSFILCIMPSLLPTLKCPSLQSSCVPCGVMWLTVVCREGPSLDFLGRKHSFSGFFELGWALTGYRLPLACWGCVGSQWPWRRSTQLCLLWRNGGNLLFSLFSLFSTIVLYGGNLFSNRFSLSNVSWDLPWVCYDHIFPRKNFINASTEIDSDIKVMDFPKIRKHAVVFLLYSAWQPWLARWHRWGSCMANHPSALCKHPLSSTPSLASLPLF